MTENINQTVDGQADLSSLSPCHKTAAEMFQNVLLTFTTLWANLGDDKLEIYFLFFQKINFDISCKLFSIFFLFFPPENKL